MGLSNVINPNDVLSYSLGMLKVLLSNLKFMEPISELSKPTITRLTYGPFSSTFTLLPTPLTLTANDIVPPKLK